MFSFFVFSCLFIISFGLFLDIKILLVKIRFVFLFILMLYWVFNFKFLEVLIFICVGLLIVSVFVLFDLRVLILMDC